MSDNKGFCMSQYRASVHNSIHQQIRPINLSLSQFLKDGCIGERQMALVSKKHKRPEGQQVAHILTLNLY